MGRSGRRRVSNQSREAEIIRNRRQRAASVLQLLHRGGGGGGGSGGGGQASTHPTDAQHDVKIHSSESRSSSGLTNYARTAIKHLSGARELRAESRDSSIAKGAWLGTRSGQRTNGAGSPRSTRSADFVGSPGRVLIMRSLSPYMSSFVAALHNDCIYHLFCASTKL